MLLGYGGGALRQRARVKCLRLLGIISRAYHLVWGWPVGGVEGVDGGITQHKQKTNKKVGMKYSG